MLEVKVPWCLFIWVVETSSLIFEPKPEGLREQTLQISEGNAFRI